MKLTVTRDRAGRFFLPVLVEEVIAPLPTVFLPGGHEPKAVGLDLGLVSLVTLDDGEKLPHPRLLAKYGKQLATLQRELHRKQKGSKSPRKTGPVCPSGACRAGSGRRSRNSKVKSVLLCRRPAREEAQPSTG